MIIGQGLAGTVISSYLFKNNIAHKVIDNDHQGAATKAAAGLINPITGRGYVKSWMIDELIEEARIFYEHMSDLLSVQLVSETVILRTLRNASQFNKWHASTSRASYDTYLDEGLTNYDYDDILNELPRYGVIKHAFQIDISQMIREYRKILQDKNALVNRSFDHSRLTIQDGGFFYDNEHYKLLIFCEGYQAVYNPYFKELPFQLAKGECLELDIVGFDSEQILRDDIFLVPLKNGVFWSGGGYQWEFKDGTPTEEWRRDWEEKLSQILRKEYRILAHKAGIRPSVKGRRPLIGEHKDNSNMYIFNGMGTKGTSLAPYWARHFVEQHLIKGIPIDAQVDINRFEY